MTEMPPVPRPPKAHPPLIDASFAALGWLYRASAAVGSARFVETLDRTRFYLERADEVAHTPGDVAVVQGLYEAVDGLIAANANARGLLADSCSGMTVADAVEFVELIEGGEDLADVDD